jgi:hypothetical protein
MSGNIHAEQTKGVQDEDVHSHWQLACQGVGLHCFTQNRLAFMFYGTYTKSPCPKKRPLSEIFMLVSCLFCRLVATSLQIAVVSFAENGRYLKFAASLSVENVEDMSLR